MSEHTTDIELLYLGYFGRPADPDGLAYWSDVANLPGHGLTDVGAALAQSAEFLGANGHGDPGQVVGQVYQNLFGRAAEPAGLNYWSGKLQAGALTLAQVVDTVIGGAQGSDLAAMHDRLTVAHSAMLEISRLDHIKAFDDPAVMLRVHDMLGAVSDDASMGAALARVPYLLDPQLLPTYAQTPHTAQIQADYIGYTGRPADLWGQFAWQDVIDQQQGPMSLLPQVLSTSSEFNAPATPLTPVQIVGEVYLNLFGRMVDADGASYWSHLLTTQALTTAQIVDAIAASAAGADKVALQDKLVVANAFTAALAPSNAFFIYRPELPVQLRIGHDFLAGVRDDASMAAALAQLDTVIGSLSPKPGGPPLAQAHDAAVAQAHDAGIALVGIDAGGHPLW